VHLFLTFKYPQVREPVHLIEASKRFGYLSRQPGACSNVDYLLRHMHTCRVTSACCFASKLKSNSNRAFNRKTVGHILNQMSTFWFVCETCQLNGK